MADVNAEIGVNIDTSSALAQLKSLQREIARFHASVAKSSEAAALAQRDLQKNFLNGINSIRGFSAELRTVKTTAESFTDSLERNKFSMREYFRYSMASTKTFGRLFRSELDTVSKVAEENVKRLQTQYIKMGRDANGVMKAIAVMPTKLNIDDYATQTQLAAQKQAIFNQLVKQGSTNLLNFGKNTQWAGRQLMVGFTIPLIGLGSAASKTFMDMETAAIKFRKVYGDLFTPTAEREQALKDIEALGDSFTKYGIAVSQTVSLAADAAAAGFRGIDLQRQVTEATRLQVLGQIEQQKALETTISLQNAFRLSSADLADSINFLNAVENQTVVSLDDITTAIPKAAPIIRELGGDVKDLAFFMSAMKEGGINASEGANALKSGLASLINPSDKARAMLNGFGIDIDAIVNKNAGNVKKTVIDFALALDNLSSLSRQRAIEQLFGKFQQARLSALFDNVIRDGNQASRVLDLAGASTEELAQIAEQELGVTAESSMFKFRKSVEDLKKALVPVGQLFLEIVTPFLENIGNILDKFNDLSAGTKKIIGILTIGLGAIAPVVLMTVGLFANFVANGIKGLMLLRNGYLRLTGQSQILSEQTNFLTVEQQQALAAAASLEQSHMRLQQVFTGEAASVRALIAEYQRMIAAQNMAATKFPGMMMPGFKPQGYAKGGEVFAVPGSGNQDTVPAMLTPGEIVIPKKQSQKYFGLIQGIVADNIPGYAKSNLRTRKTVAERTQNVPIYPDIAVRFQSSSENQSQLASVPGLADVLGPLVARVGESRGLGFGPEAKAQYPDIIGQYRELVQTFLTRVEASFNANAESISNESERLAVAWQTAGRETEQEIAAVSSQTDQNIIRQALGVDPDSYGTIAANFRAERGFGGRTARYPEGNIPTSYTDPTFKRAAGSAYELISGEQPQGMDIGHIFDLKTRKKLGMPTTVSLEELRSDTNIATTAIRELERSISQAEQELANKIEAAGRTLQNSGVQMGESIIDGIAQGTQSASPSEAAKRQGQNVADGFEQGLLEGMDDVSMAGQKLGDAASNGIKTSDVETDIRYTQGSIPGLNVATPVNNVAESLDNLDSVTIQAAETTSNSSANLSKWNNRMMSASFALSSISGIAMAFGNNLGGAGDIIFKVSSAMFALQGVVQLLTQAKLLELAATRLAAAKQASALATYGAGMASRAGMAGMIGRIGVFARTLLGLTNPIGWIITGLTAGAIAYKLINDRINENRRKIDGLGDAALIAGDKLKTLDEIFGVNSKQFAFENFKFTGVEQSKLLTSSREQAAQDLIQNEKFQKRFKDDIAALRTATTKEAQLVLEGLAIQLQTRGYSVEQVQTITDALIKEAGQTEVSLDFKKLDINTAENQKELTKNVNQVLAKYNKSFAKGINDSYRRTLNLTAKSIAGSLGALQLQLTSGTLSAKDYATQIANINQQILAMPDSTAKLNLVNAVFAAMGEDAKKAAAGVENINNKLLLMQAMMLNAADQESIALLSSPDLILQDIGRRRLIKGIDKAYKDLAKGLEEVNKQSNGTGVNTDAGKGITIQEKLIKLYEKQISVLEKKLKALQDVNNEMDRQNEFIKDQMDLDRQIAEAKISGNYLEAAALSQQKLYNKAEFNRETQEIEIQKQIDKIRERIDVLESKGNKATLTDAEKRLLKLESNNKNNKVKKNKDDKDKSKDSTKDTDEATTITVDSATKNPVVAAKSPDEAKKAAEAPKVGNRPIPAPPGVPQASSQEYYFNTKTGKWDKLTRSSKTPIGYVSRQEWIKGKKTYAGGGSVSGPGTSTSDSIPAFLSNGEYVINAGSVNKYGVELFEALNAKKFKNGGIANSLSKIPSSLPSATFSGIRNLAMAITDRNTYLPKPGDKTGLFENSGSMVSGTYAKKKYIDTIGLNVITGSKDKKTIDYNLEQVKRAAEELTKATGVEFVIGPADKNYNLYFGKDSGMPQHFLDAWKTKAAAGFSHGQDLAFLNAKKINLVGGDLNAAKKTIIHELIHSVAQNSGETGGSHTLNPFNIMFPALLPGLKTSISKADIRAIRELAGYYRIDLPNGNWTNPEWASPKYPKLALGGYVNMASLPKFKNGIDNVPYDMPAILHKNERVLTAEENKRYGETNSTINATFNITGGNSDEIVNKVMVKLNTLNNKNNKSNKVGR